MITELSAYQRNKVQSSRKQFVFTSYFEFCGYQKRSFLTQPNHTLQSAKMSKTPILSKKQQKASLSAKKAKTKQTLRNVLATPFSKYWPLVSNDHYQALKNVLYEHLPKLLPEKAKIPWKELKNIPKSERKQFREKYAAAHLQNTWCPKDIKREGIILGINDVTKALEQNLAKSVLITEDVLPRLMVEHIVDQAVLLGIPVLVIPQLRTILKEKCGISSVAVAFTDCSKFKLVQQTIEKLSKSYPVPENHINFDRSLILANDTVIVIDDTLDDIIIEGNLKTNEMDIPCIVIEDSIMEDISNINATDMRTNDEKLFDKIPESYKSDQIVSDYDIVKNRKPKLILDTKTTFEEGSIEKATFLIRKSKNERMFVPENSTKMLKTSYKMNVDSLGFISFSDAASGKEKDRKEYKSLKVKQVKGDNNRTNRKIKAMKERKGKQKGKKRQMLKKKKLTVL